MANEKTVQTFLENADDWICENYWVSIRFFAEHRPNGDAALLSAQILMSPALHRTPSLANFSLENIVVGSTGPLLLTKEEAMEIANLACQGKIAIGENEFHLTGKSIYQHSEFQPLEKFIPELNLLVSGDDAAQASDSNRENRIDATLRIAEEPYDGLPDLLSTFGLTDPRNSSSRPTLTIRIHCPVGINALKSSIENGKLRLLLTAHPKFKNENLKLALRTESILDSTRQQIASQVSWDTPTLESKTGNVFLECSSAHSVQVMVSVGKAIGQRQWFTDGSNAPNLRYALIAKFDHDLKMVKRELLSPSDSKKFELATACLFFLQGFSSAVQLETDAPDIILFTPEESVVIVECTMRMADFQSKLSKLIERRNVISAELNSRGEPRKVYSVLVCALPAIQVRVDAAELIHQQVTLLCQEQLEDAISAARDPGSPDDRLRKSLQALQNSSWFLN